MTQATRAIPARLLKNGTVRASIPGGGHIALRDGRGVEHARRAVEQAMTALLGEPCMVRIENQGEVTA